MSRLVYQRDELLSEHEYARPQLEAGRFLHGGFDHHGNYISPRTRVREAAVRAWQEELGKRGYPLIDASEELLVHGPYPSFEQQSLLLRKGFAQNLWDAVSVTGMLESRGRLLANTRAPAMEERVLDSLISTATGHLNRGLLEAHGYDEGGLGADGPGGHDTMWSAVRDLLFGKDAYPTPALPGPIARPESERRMPCIPERHEQFLLLLMNILMIEIRAEPFFDLVSSLATSSGLFTDRRDAAEQAGVLVERIRQDEAIHVAYLRTVVSELRSFTFKLADGTLTEGSTFIDPVWRGMIEWHTNTRYHCDREQARRAIVEQLSRGHDSRMTLREFDDLEQDRAA